MLRAVGYKATGKLLVIDETQQVTARFMKREFVLEIAENPRYPQTVQFQLTGDRCPNLDRFRVGDEVEVEFSLRGREWKSPRGEVKYFNSLDVWTIDPVGAGRDAGPPADDGPADMPGDPNINSGDPRDDIPPPDDNDEVFDDIPF